MAPRLSVLISVVPPPRAFERLIYAVSSCWGATKTTQSAWLPYATKQQAPTADPSDLHLQDYL